MWRAPAALPGQNLRAPRVAAARREQAPATPQHPKTLTGAEQLIEQGRSEGRAEGRGELLLLLLANRFGPVDDSIRERIRNGTLDELDRWALRVLTAPTVGGVFH